MTRPHIAAVLACAAGALAVPAVAGATDPELISTFAGNGINGFAGDDGAATAAQIDGPGSMSLAPGGGYLIADAHNDRIRHVAADGRITTVAGTGSKGFNGDALPATSAKLAEPEAVAPSAGGGFLIADTQNDRIREVLPGLGVITTVAGTGNNGSTGDGLLATLAELDGPTSVEPTADGGFLIADSGNNRIRKVSALGLISTVAGTGSSGSAGDGGPATAAQLTQPYDVSTTDDGGFLIADTGSHRIRKVAPDGTITTVAGTGTYGFSGDNGPATAAQLNDPEGVEAMGGDSFLIADTANHRVRKVKAGTITTSVGDGTNAFAGDGGDPAAASLNSPVDAFVHGTATFVVDHDNHRIRLVGEVPPPPGGDGDLPVILDKPAVDVIKDILPDPEPPKVAEQVNVEPERGTVKVKLPGEGWVLLGEGASIPVGTLVDATKGSVTLTSARDANGTTQSATFSGSTFKVAQKRARRPVTELQMRGGNFSPCWGRKARRSAMAQMSAKRRRVRRLWGSGKGRFRTRGRHGAATVRGTVWSTEDSCAGTLVSVRRGKVAVESFMSGRLVLVRAGRSFLAPSRPLLRRKR